ncbi:MAG: conserved membrane protein of unknown function [Candidatus Thorarchaeota archaeon]|nr:MAG: conserved membrane protein of unknown function [Candidatus Thorarchaeota archaeon]
MQHDKKSFSIFVVIAVVFLSLLFIQLAGAVFIQIGIPAWLAFLIVPGSLLGSLVNIPIYTIESDSAPCDAKEYKQVWLITYHIVGSECPGETIVSINLGGAVIPAVVSGYLIFVNLAGIIPILLAISIVAIFVRAIAKVDPDIGIMTPALLPPLAAALMTMIVMSLFPIGINAYAIAYISGTLGTLIGADLLNAHRFDEFKTDQVSIGGAGTWDGVFLTGIIAVFLV